MKILNEKKNEFQERKNKRFNNNRKNIIGIHDMQLKSFDYFILL